MNAIERVEFRVLGSGTSAGVPIIACGCRVCTSEDPRDRRTRASACLRFRDPDGLPRTVLIDTSPDLRAQALRHSIERCDAIVFTHGHVDHIFGLDEVRRFNAVMRSSIPIYAEDETLADLRRVYRHIFDHHTNVNVSWVARLEPVAIRPGESLDLFGLRWTPLRLLHGKLPILGFRIDALLPSGEVDREPALPLPLAYCTDVSTIPDETWPRLEGIRTLVLDLLRLKPHPTHLSLDEAVAVAERVGAEATWFTHMTHDVLHAEVDAALPRRMALSYDGLSLGG